MSGISSTAAAIADKPDVDFGPLRGRIGYFLRRAQLAVFQEFIAAFAAVDVRPAQYSILTIIEANPGLSQTRVADALGIKKANFVAMIDELEARGLVERRTTRNDRRSYALTLTARGKLFVRKLHRIGDDLEQRIVTALGAKTYRELYAPLQALAGITGQREA